MADLQGIIGHCLNPLKTNVEAELRLLYLFYLGFNLGKALIHLTTQIGNFLTETSDRL